MDSQWKTRQWHSLANFPCFQVNGSGYDLCLCWQPQTHGRGVLFLDSWDLFIFFLCTMGCFTCYSLLSVLLPWPRVFFSVFPQGHRTMVMLLCSCILPGPRGARGQWEIICNPGGKVVSRVSQDSSLVMWMLPWLLSILSSLRDKQPPSTRPKSLGKPHPMHWFFTLFREKRKGYCVTKRTLVKTLPYSNKVLLLKV